mmetsp:Transcript_37018/g.68940  ORF Transcript_37018/g.68940 Transcript_37018/m.68940 type:complete len:369 (-) Transcript_37018:55-1161(-)
MFESVLIALIFGSRNGCMKPVGAVRFDNINAAHVASTSDAHHHLLQADWTEPAKKTEAAKTYGTCWEILLTHPNRSGWTGFDKQFISRECPETFKDPKDLKTGTALKPGLQPCKRSGMKRQEPTTDCKGFHILCKDPQSGMPVEPGKPALAPFQQQSYGAIGSNGMQYVIYRSEFPVAADNGKLVQGVNHNDRVLKCQELNNVYPKLDPDFDDYFVDSSRTHLGYFFAAVQQTWDNQCWGEIMQKSDRKARECKFGEDPSQLNPDDPLHVKCALRSMTYTILKKISSVPESEGFDLFWDAKASGNKQVQIWRSDIVVESRDPEGEEAYHNPRCAAVSQSIAALQNKAKLIDVFLDKATGRLFLVTSDK